MNRKQARRKRCPTGKAWFRDRIAAQMFSFDKGGSLRPYNCPHCRRWHVTSQPPRSKETK